MVDKVRSRALERQTIRMEEDLRKTIEDLRHGNIHEVLAKAKIPKAEIHKFFAQQWSEWQSQIIQNYETYASEGSIPDPKTSDFNQTDSGNSFKPGDGALFLDGMFGTGKAAVVSKDAAAVEVEGEGVDAELSEGAEGPMTLDELEQAAEGTLDEWEGFMGEMWSTVLDAQMMRDYEARMSEIKAEVQRILALAKEGKIGVEFVLLALAKVNLTKNGVLFSYLGKKAAGLNEQINSASEELSNMSTSDPNYTATLTQTQAATREGTYQLNIVTGDMQKVMQNVASTLESVHGMMGEINRTRREMVTKLSAR